LSYELLEVSEEGGGVI